MYTISTRLLIVFFIFLAFPLLVSSQTVFATESLECNSRVTITDPVAGTYTKTAPDTEPSLKKTALSVCTSIDTGSLGFQIPTLSDILTFVIRVFFVIAGIAALFYMLIGAFAWVTSGGDKDAVTAAREKIQAAVIGMIMIVAVLAVIWTLEQVIFKRKICLGLSCPLTLPGLINTNTTIIHIGSVPAMDTRDANCCVCTNDDGTLGERINTYTATCSHGVGKPL